MLCREGVRCKQIPNLGHPPRREPVRTNRQMAAKLRQERIEFPLPKGWRPLRDPIPKIILHDGCIFQKSQLRLYEVTRRNHPDSSDFEDFANHDHLPYNGSRRSLLHCLKYALKLADKLRRFLPGKRFEISVICQKQDRSCRISFHQVRRGEYILAPDLDSYRGAAILLFGPGEVE